MRFNIFNTCNIDIIPRWCGRRHTWPALTMILVFKCDHASLFSKNKIFKWSYWTRFSLSVFSWIGLFFYAQVVSVHTKRWFGFLIVPKSRKWGCSLDKDYSGKLFDNIICNLFQFYITFKPRKNDKL